MTKYKKMIMKRTSPAGHHENQSNEKDEGSDDAGCEAAALCVGGGAAA